MSPSQPELRWDLKFAEGSAAEHWLEDTLDGGATIEVKRSKILEFLNGPHVGPFIEYECLHADGVWHKSGIAVSEAAFWFLKFGGYPAGLLVERQWLLRAARLAYTDETKRRELSEGDNPTRGVVVTLSDLEATRWA